MGLATLHIENSANGIEKTFLNVTQESFPESKKEEEDGKKRRTKEKILYRT